MNILVTDGENRSALAVTRSLGRKGCNVTVCSKELGNISASSKFCSRSFVVPEPMSHCGNYFQAVAEIVRTEKIDVIFPMTEQSIYSLNNGRMNLGGHVIMACAPPEKMETISNKSKLFLLAEKLGVPMPETMYVTDIEDFKGKVSGISRFPVVVKPSFSKIKDGDRMISTKVMYAANQHELVQLYETKPELRYPSLIQELISGEGTGLFTLFDQDRHLALFSHRRILEKPPSGGVSVLSESVRLDSEMVDAAGKLLSEVQWSGIAMVEFKRDKRDGKAKLMEINGRFWGSLQLAVSSGMDFPLLGLDFYLNRKPPDILKEYSVGHRLKWFFGMLDHLIIRIKSGERLYGVPADFPSRWWVTKELLKAGEANTSFDVYDSEDMMPIFTELKAYIKNLV